MPRSKIVQGRVPWPLVDCVDDQMERGTLPYSSHAQLLTSFYLWQSAYGTSHPFTEGYFRLSSGEQDKINDFIQALQEEGKVERGQLVKLLAQEAGITGEESFTEHGQKLFEALRRLAG